MAAGEFRIEWIGVAAGILSFLVAYFVDWASQKGIPGLKQAIWAVFLGLQGYALYAVSLNVARASLPLPVFWLGWVLLVISSVLLTYSLFVEIPLAKTYVRDGSGSRLVTTGTYALVRHPGVVWYSLFLLSLFFVTGSWTLVIAAPLWILMDVIYVVIQERFFFASIFPGYDEYQQQTPMLIPSRQSIIKCIKTLRPKEVLQ